MREIKFRLWDGTNCKFYQGNFAVHKNGNTINTYAMIQSDKDVLMQYTGLKDKNGKEIYEGDILSYPERSNVSHNQSKPNFPGWYGVVEFIAEDKEAPGDWITKEGGIIPGAELSTHKCGFFVGGLIYIWSVCEIIGNIYENPELLNGDT